MRSCDLLLTSEVTEVLRESDGHMLILVEFLANGRRYDVLVIDPRAEDDE